MSEVYVAAVRSDGSVAHIAFQTTMRCPIRPPSGGWRSDSHGAWVREASDANIAHDVRRFEEMWRNADGITVVSWQRLTTEEHGLFEQNRQHRNALEVVNGRVQHNMPKARELHRALLRHQAGERLLLLDRQWVDASAKDDKTRARDVAAKRQALQDVANDPRIEAAQTLAELLTVVLPDDDGV